MIRAGLGPKCRAEGRGSASTIWPGFAPFSSPRGTSHMPFWRRSVGMMRPSSNTPRMRAGAVPAIRLKVRPSYLPGPIGFSRASTRSPAVSAGWPFGSGRM